MISGVGHKHGAYNDDDNERKHRRYCDKHINNGEHVDGNDNYEENHIRESIYGRNSSYYKKALQNYNYTNNNNYTNEDDDDDNDDDNIDYKNVEKSRDKNYNCHYKIKSVPMSAIRCRLDEPSHHHQHQQQQQHYERRLFHQQQISQNVNNSSDTEHTVINLARSNAIMECTAEGISQNHNQATHMSYNLSSNVSHAYTTTQHQHYAHAHATKHDQGAPTDLVTSHYPQTHTPTPTTLTVSTILKTESNSSIAASIPPIASTSPPTSTVSAAEAAASRRDHNIDYSTLFVQLSGTLPTLYRCVNCNKIVSNRWHHANIHRPQSHVCPVCGQKFTRRDNMKAHCKIKHADIKDRFFSHYVHM